MAKDRAADLEIGARLKTALGDLSVPDAAVVAGRSENSIRRWIAGESSADALGLSRLSQHLDVSLAWLLSGKGSYSNKKPDGGQEGFAGVGVIDAFVSAGPGGNVLTEQPTSFIYFPANWLRERARDLGKLRILTVQGDSMEPDLRAGDQVMIDAGRDAPREGMYAIRLGDELLVKRVQRVSSAELLLISANPAYDDRTINLADAGNEFAIVGRVVWLGRTL